MIQIELSLEHELTVSAENGGYNVQQLQKK